MAELAEKSEETLPATEQERTNELLQRICSYVPQPIDRLVPRNYRGRAPSSVLRPRYQAFRTFGPDWRE